jgi:hypothetical protein
MAILFDLKTIRKTYSVIKKTMDRLDEQRNGFIKEAKRYSRKKDKQNELKAKSAALELSYAKDQMNKLKNELKNQFKSK